MIIRVIEREMLAFRTTGRMVAWPMRALPVGSAIELTCAAPPGREDGRVVECEPSGGLYRVVVSR